MTTTASPVPGRERTPRVLLLAASGVVAVVLATVLVGALADGRAAALGSLVGGATTLGFLVLGSVLVVVGTRLAPHAAVMVALMTFFMQVALVALVFAALSSSDAVGSTLSAGWLSAGVIAAAVAWILGQLFATARARIPAYDVPLPGDGATDGSAREVGAR
jgi:ATP synthase protein I